MIEKDAPPIVVGVDGSPDSVRALRWAAQLAALFGSPIEAIMVWEPPIEFGWTYPVALRTDDWQERCMQAMHRAVDEAYGTQRPPRLRLRVIEGYPAARLIEASKGAELLIVGSRGHGGFASLVLGSVGVKCVEHAHCPVLVARHEHTAAEHAAEHTTQTASTTAPAAATEAQPVAAASMN